MKWVKNVFQIPYLIVIFICLIIIARIVWPNINYDDTSFYLTLLAVIIFVIPNIGELFSRIKRLKKGDFEIELESKLDSLTEKTEKAEEDIEKLEIEEFEFKSKPDEIRKRIIEYTKDPRGGLISIAIEINSMISKLATYYQLFKNVKHISPIRTIDVLTNRGLVPNELQSLIRDFWIVRNQAVHSSEFQLTNQQLYRLLDLGIRILDLLSYRKPMTRK
ncbi:hypothetical protein A2V47_00310 [Candidatus Atribacteria bacterium RBG_19FT_COMBO_35_14]|uniref:DUF4145 domain-containing protein n=1 Tax=Candidatus Sediminicultor quintus TaxID=1797291 RepID=A0A1F5AFY7_9BACT|nr:MAG: hypothetical protein A2V47_00310 [Candidatus Atribacteria bacterium RBG_19FT_COMBO_35_14]